MKRWFKDASFRGLLRNTGYLASSRVGAALFGLIALSASGRSLGVAAFGILVLIHSYAQSAAGLVKFQSWQLVIRYGTPALHKEDVPEFQRAVSFAFGLDLVSGFLGMAAAMAALPLIGYAFGIGEDYLLLALLYCTILPTMSAATPTGVMRVLDRFDLLAWQGIVTPGLRAVLTAGAWMMELPLTTFVLIWYVTDLAGDLVLWGLAGRELHRRGLLKGIRPGLKEPARMLPGSWRFAFTTNMTASLITAWGPMANLLVGALLGTGAAGLYRVGATLADAAAKPADMLAKAFYPEVMRMDFATKRPWKLMLRGAALSGAVGLVLCVVAVVAGRPLISLVFGESFVAAYPLLLTMIGALVVTMISFPLVPMLYSLDRPGSPLVARLIATGLYLAVILPLTEWLGLIGAGVAYVLGIFTMTLLMASTLYQEYRRRRSGAPILKRRRSSY